MSDIAIHVEHLSKQYHIGQKAPYMTFREAITNAAAAPLKRIIRGAQSSDEQGKFWALKDVSFDVEKGEVVGIIGRNGAGKSTLLKILSKVTEPTEGFAKIYGRVGSLLEVGTGFHPELTGRENVYLSGAILGMKRSEIESKFDDIIKFAETEKFLDTPLKHYSSGMQVRLGFSVAAHLEPEILIVDEVLAVGDAAFQKKCLGKMGSVAKEGRTILFVSHQMNAVEKLCNRGLLLENGKVAYDSDNIHSVIHKYQCSSDQQTLVTEWVNTGERFNNPYFKPIRFYIGDNEGNPLEMPICNVEDIWVFIEGNIETLDPALELGYCIYTEDGYLLYITYQTDQEEELWPKMKRGKCIIRSKIPKQLLNEGIYRLELSGSLYCRQYLFEPSVNSPSIFLNINNCVSNSPYWQWKRPTSLAPIIKWETI